MATTRGYVNSTVQATLKPNCAPPCEYVAMPLGSSSAAPVIRPGPSFPHHGSSRLGFFGGRATIQCQLDERGPIALPRRNRRMDIQPAEVLGDPGDLQTDPLDRVHRLQPLRADLGAVHDRSASEQPVRIVVQVVEPLLGRAVAAVEDE